jgi:ABC-type glycerol-3-phosphate transport system substrate-binding protein
MKKLLTAVLVGGILLSAAACGTTSNTPANTGTSDTSNNTPVATTPDAPPEPVKLNIATAGDTNMTEFFQNEVGPAFTAKYPHITLNVVGTGAGDDGSRAIYTKWEAQKSAGTAAWDIDVACVHEAVMDGMIANGLIERYVPSIGNSQYVNTPASKMCLGINVDGYVVPLFQSQVVLAY